MKAAQNPKHPPLEIGVNTVYFGLEWLVVEFVIVCDLGAQADPRVFLTSCLCGRQLADQEERSDEWDHLCALFNDD